jgi:acyl carrier protein
MYKADIRNFIVENFLYGRQQDFADDASFLDNGLIDSTGVIELVAFLGEKYGINVEDEELVPDNLDSVINLSGFIERKLEKAG